jgi:hypothetical protein
VKVYKNEKGLLHREDGPAIEKSDGHKEWYLNGKQHRIDGPAVIFANGDKYWYQNGESHRLDGPAQEYIYGHKEWYINGKRHRLDGPAIEYLSGYKGWWINDKEYDYDLFEKLTSFLKESYSINEAGITYIRLEDNLGIRISLYTELFINGTCKIIQDETLEQLIKGIDKRKPFLNPLHDYILENLTSLNV